MPQYRRILPGATSGSFTSRSSAAGPIPTGLTSWQRKLQTVARAGVQIVSVLGGGNISRYCRRGSSYNAQGDHMGMLATVINAFAFQDALERQQVPRASATFHWKRAQRKTET